MVHDGPVGVAETRLPSAVRALAVTLSVVLGLAACRTEPVSEVAVDASAVFSPRGEIDAAELTAIRSFLEERIAHELEHKAIPAIAVALSDSAGTLFSDGFGRARFVEPGEEVEAARDTVFRVGSVSKLFTDIAVMQWVERGELDLDAPITDVLPDFRPENPFATPVTLRQLMCHRAGLVREPPVGHYFDDTEPTLEETVLSLNGTRLVHEPGTVTKYSNAGIAVVGLVLERLSDVPFEQAVREAVLEPLGMSSSDFELSERVGARLADASMRTRDGRQFPAPGFALGMAPAGSLYSTVDELSLFAQAMLERRTVLEEQSFEEMFTPQFAQAGARSGYGLRAFASTASRMRGTPAFDSVMAVRSTGSRPS